MFTSKNEVVSMNKIFVTYKHMQQENQTFHEFIAWIYKAIKFQHHVQI